MTTLAHPLPEPLRLADGTLVSTPEAWLTRRRPELQALFAEHMYGTMPPPPGNTTAEVVGEDRAWLNGQATLRELRLRFGPAGTPPIHLLLATPNQAKGPVPVFVGLNFNGNHAIVTAPWVRQPEPARGEPVGRGANADTYPIELIVPRGYAVATMYNGDVRMDRPEVADSVQAHYPQYNFAAIAAWAWGLHRAVDYLVMDPRLDAKRIAVVGHSRNGKAALVAAAYDDRIAVAMPCQAGCGGTAPSRGMVGESVERINTVFPHWFCDRFKSYNRCPEGLPFDQHELVAICAPRPVLFTNATDDTWANPRGQFEVLMAADEVYRLLGVDGLGAAEMPLEGQVLDSRLGYWIRPGKHAMGREEWPIFLAYADRWLAAPR